MYTELADCICASFAYTGGCLIESCLIFSFLCLKYLPWTTDIFNQCSFWSLDFYFITNLSLYCKFVTLLQIIHRELETSSIKAEFIWRLTFHFITNTVNECYKDSLHTWIQVYWYIAVVVHGNVHVVCFFLSVIYICIPRDNHKTDE